VRTITVADVEYLAFRLARKHLSFDEPIPDFTTRFPNVLESCVVTPFQKFSGKDRYPSLVAKASILFYLMTKNHPYQNGNRRIAITTVLTFLLDNRKWLRADGQELYNLMIWVAQSSAEFKDEVVAALQRFIRGHLTDAD
jgi:prophage maintenance system killer protein